LLPTPNNKPHTDNGGCPSCQGAITIDGNNVGRNLAYYTIAHVSKFIPPNSVRIESSLPDGLSDVAFQTPDGKTVLVVANRGKETQNFNVVYKDKALQAVLNGGSVATYVW
jgi:glucosylceramidase